MESRLTSLPGAEAAPTQSSRTAAMRHDFLRRLTISLTVISSVCRNVGGFIVLCRAGFILIVLMVAVGRGQDVPVATTAPEINLRRTVTVDVVGKTKDAVVYISTTKLVQTSPFGNDPFFRQFFQQNMAVQSLGSGFIVHEDGYVVTNNHVIDRAREIHVDLSEGKEKLPAELIATDPDADLAILKIKTDKPLPYLELGDSSD